MRGILIIILIINLLASCSSNEEDMLLVATAANVQFAMEELTAAFYEESGISIEIIYGSSGKLTAQIMEGAPFDIFVSADMKYSRSLHRGGFTTAAPEVYAYGKLVLWTLEEGFSLELDMLAHPAAKHIAIANPKNAPYGEAAEESLKYYGLYSLVQDKLVYGESISQINQFILSRTASLGITAKSVVLSPKLKGKGKWKELPEESYSPIQQGVVLLKKQGKNRLSAEKFYTFLFSEKAQGILQDFGYDTRLMYE